MTSVPGAIERAGTATGNAINAGAGALSNAGTAVGKAVLEKGNFIGNVAGAAVGHGNAFFDDKLRVGATDVVAGLGGTAGTIFGGSVGTAVLPVAGTLAGGAVGAYYGEQGGRWLGEKIFGGDEVLRRNGYDPDRGLVDMGRELIEGKSDTQLFGGKKQEVQGPPASAAPAAAPAAAAGKPAVDPKDPYAAQNAAKLAAGGVNAPAAGQPAAAAVDPNVIRRIDRPGQSPLFTNVGDGGLLGNDALMNRRPMTAQNAQAMDALVARDALRSEGAAQSSQYADEVRQAQATNQAEAARLNGWDARVRQWNDPFSEIGRARRNMEVSLGSMTPYHLRGKDGDALKAAQLSAYNDFAKTHFGMAGGDRDDATRRYQSDQTLRGNMYQADQTLRGNMYQADSQLTGQVVTRQAAQQKALRDQALTSQLWEQSGRRPEVFRNLAMQYGREDLAKTGGELFAANQTQAQANSKDAREMFKGTFFKDGVEDAEAASVAARLAPQIVPGFENMTQEQRNAVRPKVEATTRMLMDFNQNRDKGIGTMLGAAPGPAFSQLPDMNGATIDEVGPIEAILPWKPAAGSKEITLRNGRKTYLPAGQYDEAQLRVLEDNGVIPKK